MESDSAGGRFFWSGLERARAHVMVDRALGVTSTEAGGYMGIDDDRDKLGRSRARRTIKLAGE